jgi:hypothetical protein
MLAASSQRLGRRGFGAWGGTAGGGVVLRLLFRPLPAGRRPPLLRVSERVIPDEAP